MTNLCDGDYFSSEIWMTEEIFTQLNDLNMDGVSPKWSSIDGEQDSYVNGGTIGSEVHGLGTIDAAQASEEPQQQNESLFPKSEPDAVVKKEMEFDQDQTSIEYFDPILFLPQFVKCASCSCIFDADSFRQHVCDSAEVIISEPIDQSMASFQSGLINPPCMRLLHENQIRIRRFLKDELKYNLNTGSTRSKKEDSPHKCTVCERKFVHASGLSRHMEKHAFNLTPTTNNRYPTMTSLRVVIKCTICGRIFFQPKTAFEHFCLHFPGIQEDEEEFEAVAEFPYENYLDVALNILKIESKKPENQPTVYLKIVILSCVLQCEFCDFLFSDVYHLFTHSACHQPEKPFECYACEIHVSTSKEICVHWQAECVFVRENLKGGHSSRSYYVCNVCENKFGSLEQLHEHRYTAYHFFPRVDKRGVLQIPCEYCDRVFETASDVVNHFKEKHYKMNDKRDPRPKTRRYLCDICGKTYTQSSHLRQHLRFHQGIKPFACKEPGCSRRFTIRPDLNDHIRKCHTGERPYHCQVCGRNFLTGSVFYQHRLIHRGERRYGCDECGKRFLRSDALKNHLRIHTGEKPYGCLFCTKYFRQSGDRAKHMRARHSSLNANARLMMQKHKFQLEAAARASASSVMATEDVLMVGNTDIDIGKD